MSEYNSAYTGAQIDEAVRKSLADVENPVSSFNGRKGAVTPQSGDYTAEDVGARPNTWTPTASDIGLKTETWTFTLEDGNTVTKAVFVG